MRVRLLVLCALVVMASNVAWARSTALSLGLPLTPQEQAARLWNLADTEVATQLHPSRPRVVGRVTVVSFYQRNYRTQWFEGSLDGRTNRRVLLGEKIGEQGRGRFAAERGLTKLVGSEMRVRGVRVGPDSVYWNPHSGRVVALEAKGGASPLKWTFNSRQGTNRNTLRSARNILNRRSATRGMKVQMARVILAAEKGQLDTGVIRTTHVLGKPNAPQLTVVDSATVAREARKARLGMIRAYPQTKEYFREAARDHLRDRKAFRAEHRGLVLRQRAAQGLRVAGFAGALGLGWEGYRQLRMAWLLFDDPILNGSVLPYMQTGVALGRAAQAVTVVPFAMEVAERRSILNLSAKGKAVRIAGKAFLPHLARCGKSAVGNCIS